MKSLVALLWLVCLVVPLQSVFAIDPGTADGELQVNGQSITIRQAYAHLHDNAEGLLDFKKELRIVLADRAIPEDALAGLVFLPVREMAKEGKVQGLLIEFDPGSPNSLLVTLLCQPSDPGGSLVTQTITTTGPDVMKELKVGDQRVTGKIENHEQGEADPGDIPKLDYTVRFSAPLFREPSVTADLKGKEAQASPQVAVLRLKADALAKGDFNAVQKLSSHDANRRNAPFLTVSGPKAKAYAKEAGANMKRSIAKVQRVVVRGDRATVICPNRQWMTFVQESGEWKSDD